MTYHWNMHIGLGSLHRYQDYIFFYTIFIEGTNITTSGLQNSPHNIPSHLNDGSDKQLWAFINL